MTEKHGYISTLRPQDVIENLPSLTAFSGINHDIDIFICSAGFENRCCKNIPLIAAKTPSKVIIGKYSTNEPDNDGNLHSIVDGLTTGETTPQYANPYEPSEVRFVIKNTLQELSENKKSTINVVFDLSGSCGTFIMSVMHSLFQHCINIRLTLLYTEADTYFPTYDDFQENKDSLIEQANVYGDSETFLEHGILSPSVNELFSGLYHEAHSNLLIVIPSFRNNRLLRCIQEYGGEQALSSPNKSIYWLLSNPSSPENSWRVDFQKGIIVNMFNNCGDQPYSDKNQIFEQSRNIDMRNYTEALKEVITIADSELHFGKNMHLINMGTKMQTLGCALALLARPEIGSVFAAPSAFNAEKYSQGVGKTYSVIFEDYSKTINELKTIGIKKFSPIEAGKDIEYFQ